MPDEPADDGAQDDEPADRPRLFGVMPGALLFRARRPQGVPETETDRGRQLHTAKNSKALVGIPAKQRDVLIGSLVRTVGRAEYHYRRFLELRGALDELRQQVPGDVFWDGMATCMHYEMQALAGAARVFVDELVYLAAARHTPALSGSQAAKWKAKELICTPLSPESKFDVPEVRILRGHVAWFDALNAYRNTFFHSSWEHGTGHYDADGGQASVSPARNALLVPDRGSLTTSSKPSDWTWEDGTTVDDVCERVHTGLETVIGELCEGEWGCPVPAPGSVPKDQRPNVLVTLAKPVVLELPNTIIVPVFSTKEKAEEFVEQVPGLAQQIAHAGHELCRIRSYRNYVDVEAISLTLHGLCPPAGVVKLVVYLDPIPRAKDWSLIDAAARAEIPLEHVMNDEFKMIDVPVTEISTAFVWRSVERDP